jgi:hypothetical protein
MDRRAEAIQKLQELGVPLGRYYGRHEVRPPDTSRQCDGKKQFTANAARRASRWRNFDRLHSYKCELCPWWHIGGGIK